MLRIRVLVKQLRIRGVGLGIRCRELLYSDVKFPLEKSGLRIKEWRTGGLE